METTNRVETQFLKCLSFSKDDVQLFKETAKKKGYTMPRLYHDAVLKGVALIYASTAQEDNRCQK